MTVNCRKGQKWYSHKVKQSDILGRQVVVTQTKMSSLNQMNNINMQDYYVNFLCQNATQNSDVDISKLHINVTYMYLSGMLL